ncbi:phage repressor [Bordetella trematum]|uniref:S24 family peptidase n=1 Tax=Bordetella trematum TaxID=123899 RepID=UPI0007954529|nr:S24 family peptidase [Bordetella trematum]SAI62933.1 phage repressor [Bordetella trematum]
MDKHELRRQRLRQLIDERTNGNAAEFGRRYGYERAQVSQFLSPSYNKGRSIGENAAAELERRVGVAPGWLDTANEAGESAPGHRWPFPSIPEGRIRSLSAPQISQIEGAIALALGQLDIGLEVVRATSGKQAPHKVGAVYVPSPDEEDPFPMAPIELAPWEGGKPVDDREHAPPPRLNLDRTVVANVGPGEPQAANERFEKVPELGDVRLAAGEGIENHTEEQTGFVQFRRSFLRSVGADAGRGRVVYAKGDSMEPIIRDGAALLVVPDLGLTLADVAAGGVYAINYDGKMIVKTVAKDRLTGRWVARSFNAQHPDIPLEGDASVRVLGRVVWAGTRLGEDERGQWIRS